MSLFNTSPNLQLQESKEELAEKYLHKKEKRQDYLNNFYIHNNRYKSLTKLVIDVDQEIKNKKINLIQKSKMIEEDAKNLGLDSCLFITPTLNTQYHKYVKIGKDNYKYNPNFGGYSINNGYKVLVELERNLLKQLAADGIKYKFIRVVEPHKSLTPHMHMLLYISKNDTDKVFKTLGNKVSKGKKYIQKSHTKFQINVKPKKENDLGKMEVEVLENVDRGVSYLTKYVGKNVGGLAWVQGWLQENKIRMITASNTNLPLFVAKKLFHYVPQEFKNGGVNAQSWIRKNTNITYFKQYEDLEKEDETIYKLKKDNAFFDVKVYKSVAVGGNTKIDRIIVYNQGSLIYDSDLISLISVEDKYLLFELIENKKILKERCKASKEVQLLFKEFEKYKESLLFDEVEEEENSINVIYFGCVEDTMDEDKVRNVNIKAA